MKILAAIFAVILGFGLGMQAYDELYPGTAGTGDTHDPLDFIKERVSN